MYVIFTFQLVFYLALLKLPLGPMQVIFWGRLILPITLKCRQRRLNNYFTTRTNSPHSLARWQNSLASQRKTSAVLVTLTVQLTSKTQVRRKISLSPQITYEVMIV